MLGTVRNSYIYAPKFNCTESYSITIPTNLCTLVLALMSF